MRSKRNHRGKKIGILVLVLLILGTISVSAGDGKSPLTLESSYPADGEKNIPVDLKEIKLYFSKNVVNMGVKDGNMQCFQLYDEQSEIPIDVIMADDQLEREKRNEIILVPKEGLKKNAAYIVKISENLQSKSGAKLDKPIEIKFSTEGKSNTNPFLWIGMGLVIGFGYFRLRKRR